MRRASIAGLLALVSLLPHVGQAQTRRTDPLASFRGLSIDALIEQAATPVPEARALIACTLRQRRAAAAPAMKVLLDMLADETPLHPSTCYVGDGWHDDGREQTSPGMEAARALAAMGAPAF